MTKKRSQPLVASRKSATTGKATKDVSALDGLEDLRTYLADTFVLYMKTYAVHWNYTGAKFFSVHRLTEEQYGMLEKSIDETAERIRALGYTAPVSLRQILGSADMNEIEDEDAHGDAALAELAASHRELSRMARDIATRAEDQGDLYTHDMLVLRSGEHDKAAWMLSSFSPS